jgi:hypothetical protein
MGVKESLLQTLQVLEDCLSDPALIDQAPHEIAHNARAGMLRQGLAVLVFSAIETFIRERTGEVFGTFNPNVVNFIDLPDSLQKAATSGALEGVRFRMKFEHPVNRASWVAGSVVPISTAINDASMISKLSFGYASSNLTESDVLEIMKAFGIEKPWDQISAISRRAGVAILNAESEFIAIKERRHSSAHVLASNVPYSNLLGSVRSARVICLSFDMLISRSRSILNSGQKVGKNGVAVTQGDVSLVFVAPKTNTSHQVLKEQLPPPAPQLHRRTIRVLPTLQMAIDHATRHGAARQVSVVVHDGTGTPSDWVSH